ncbi:MAG: tRNA 2-thiocytidine biosynthesis protein TtcA [Ruminococcaceae bacterium]|nr:tRNA 2-thiocytidine biosynthesis protein TtcA [Oscillospiraceae bacterium]
MQKILSPVRKCVQDFDMIKNGDKIAIGVSAGKDSLTLLCAMAALSRFYPEKFELVAITVDMGFDGKQDDFASIRALCEQLDVAYHVIHTHIAEVVFDIRQEKSPCSLCANMRRGALNDAAKELGCNKVALGHHHDDAVETFFLNLFQEGRLGCFSAVTYLSRKDLTVLRPMLYVDEKDIRSFAIKENLPVQRSACKADGNTHRQKMKDFISELQRENHDIKEKVFNAMKRSNLF